MYHIEQAVKPEPSETKNSDFPIKSNVFIEALPRAYFGSCVNVE